MVNRTFPAIAGPYGYDAILHCHGISEAASVAIISVFAGSLHNPRMELDKAQISIRQLTKRDERCCAMTFLFFFLQGSDHGHRIDRVKQENQ